MLSIQAPPIHQSIIPHARTLRKARIQVQLMVNDGFSTQRIRSYLKKWALWWQTTSDVWQYDELLNWFINACWDFEPKTYAKWLLQNSFTLLNNGPYGRGAVAVTAA